MKRTIVTLTLFVSSVLAVPAFAATPHESFSQANRALSQGHYEEAAHAYEAILAEHGGAPGLYANLGRAYEGLGEVGPAIAAYERARLMLPFDRKLEKRIDALRKDAGLEAPVSGILRYIADGSPAAFSWTFLVSALLLAGIAVGWMVRPARHWRYAIAVGLFGLVPSLPGLVAWERWHPDFVVITDAVSGRISPFVDAEAAFSLKPGETLKGRRHVHGFVFVTTPDGRQGWVNARKLADLATHDRTRVEREDDA